MKKLQKFALALALITISAFLFSLVGCVNIFAPDNSDGVTITFIVLDPEGGVVYNKSAETEKSFLYDAIVSDFPDILLTGTTYESMGQNDFFLNKIEYGDVTLSESVAEKKFFLLYTDIDDPLYANSAWGTLVYEGKTYSSAASGAALLPVIDGAIYIYQLSSDVSW